MKLEGLNEIRSLEGDHTWYIMWMQPVSVEVLFFPIVNNV
jgi:hypothetical protein